MSWKVITSKPALAQDNMDKDRLFLEKIGVEQTPILHLYTWEKEAATYGYFIKPEEYFIQNHGLDLGRRPTGGGIIFHTCDLAFSVIIPAIHPCYSLNTLQNYASINNAVIEAIKTFTKGALSPSFHEKENQKNSFSYNNFCMAKPTQFDVMIDGYKVGGAAQRRTKQGLLHQGSLSLTLPSKKILTTLLRDEDLIHSAMRNWSYPLLGKKITQEELSYGKERLQTLLIQHLTEL